MDSPLKHNVTVLKDQATVIVGKKIPKGDNVYFAEDGRIEMNR